MALKVAASLVCLRIRKFLLANPWNAFKQYSSVGADLYLRARGDSRRPVRDFPDDRRLSTRRGLLDRDLRRVGMVCVCVSNVWMVRSRVFLETRCKKKKCAYDHYLIVRVTENVGKGDQRTRLLNERSVLF